MRRSLLISLLVVLVTGLIFAGCAAPAPASKPAPAPTPAPAPAPAKTVELRLATHTPGTHYMVKAGFEPWAKKIEEGTKGRVKVTLYVAGALGKVPETWDMVRKGVAEIGMVVPSAVPGLFPLYEYLSLPFLIGYDKDSMKVADKIFKQYIEPTEFKEVKLLWWHRWNRRLSIWPKSRSGLWKTGRVKL